MLNNIIRSAAVVGVIALGVTGAAAQSPPVGGKGQGAPMGVTGSSTQGQIGSSGGGAVSTETVTGAGVSPQTSTSSMPAGTTTVQPVNPQAEVGGQTSGTVRQPQ
ncbi:hypothetical protein ACFQI3_03195 [Hansschlegelia quercus]|uniref:Uncharacterized protein n=1 Tax=Hansschlegelia quercus TaxID=2528245 RepID=A0A4Q9GQ37_9HYPH|nr:hypothetical protein [Hansschlegelia quercus]TBN54914.1 hypothetical protein EYR15_01805 [Hansschlegelia quercus]